MTAPSQRRRRLSAALLGTALAAATLGVSAQTAPSYPSRPVRLLVSFPAGGSTDMIARELAKGLGELWNQPVVVDNKPGASGVIAGDIVAKAPPDGHTLFLALYDTLAITPWVNDKMTYDTFRDLAPMGMAALIPLVMVASNESQLKRVQDVISQAKAKPGALTFATTGIGGGQHLSMELFQRLTGTRLTHVPYKGVAAGLQDIVAGRVSLMLASPNTAMPFIKDNRVVPVAFASSRRTPQLPNVPTFAESGFPTFEASGWMGLVGPKGMPAAVVAKVNADLKRVTASSAYMEALARQGNEATYSTPTEMADRMKRDSETFGQIIKQLDLKN